MQNRFAPRAMTVIPAEEPGTAERALPREVSKHRQQAKLRPSLAVQTPHVVRAAVFADSFTQRTDLLIRSVPHNGVPFWWPHARWRRPETTEDCGAGYPV